MINDEKWHGRIFRKNSCRSAISDNVAKIMVFGHFGYVNMFQMFSNFIRRLLSTLSTFPENLSSKKFLEHIFLRILTAANMRNKPFSAISSQMVTWVDLILHNETDVITMDNCCTFWRSSIREISCFWSLFRVWSTRWSWHCIWCKHWMMLTIWLSTHGYHA